MTIWKELIFVRADRLFADVACCFKWNGRVGMTREFFETRQKMLSWKWELMRLVKRKLGVSHTKVTLKCWIVNGLADKFCRICICKRVWNLCHEHRALDADTLWHNDGSACRIKVRSPKCLILFRDRKSV